VGSNLSPEPFDNIEDANADDGDAREIYKLLEEFCSASHLKNLVKAYRPSQKEFPISVPSEELLRSIAKLHGAFHIPTKALEDILERAEENGRQHIFLYTPATKAAKDRLNKFENVQKVLLNGQTRSEAELPKFQIHPKGVAVADLRQEHREGTKYHFWVYKLYGGSERWIQTSTKITDEEKIVHYKLKYRREVFVVKWHSFGLLEIRVPTGNSYAQLAEYRDALLRDVTKITSLKEDESESASDALTRAISVRRPPKPAETEEPSKNSGVIPLEMPLSKLDSDARSADVKWIHVNNSLLDFHGTKIRVFADDEQENAYGPEVVKLLKTVRDCDDLRSIVHINDQPDSPQKLSVEFATSYSNEIRIGPQTTPEGVEFIVRRIWERAANEELPSSPVDDFGRTTEEGPTVNLVGIDTLNQKYPYLVNAFKGLKEWVQQNSTVGFVDPDRLRRLATAGVPPGDFAIALAALVEEGLLVRKFRIRPGPHRAFLSQEFDSFDEILKGDIKDTKGESLNLDDIKIVAVFGGSKG